MTEEDERLAEAQRRWNREWGPDIHPWKRWLCAMAIIGASVGLVVAALVTAG